MLRSSFLVRARIMRPERHKRSVEEAENDGRKPTMCMFLSMERAGEELGVGRTLRVVRLLRAGRLLISVPEIYILMSGLTSALKPIIFGSIMLISVIIIWAIIVVEFLHPVNAMTLVLSIEASKMGVFLGSTMATASAATGASRVSTPPL